jgi:hypothetical protein
MTILDECSGIPLSVMTTAMGVLSSGEGHVVMAGNPTHLSGPLYEAAVTQRKRWFVIEVTGDPEDPARAPRVDLEHAQQMIETYGRESAVVRARILGKFPKRATDALLGLDQIEDAYGRTVNLSGESLLPGLRVLGVDVARFGDDLTVVACRDGNFHNGFRVWAGMDTEYTADQVAMIARTLDVDEIRVDDVGVGGGVTDKLKRREDLRALIVPVNYGAAPTKTGDDGLPLYANLKAQVHMELREKYFNLGQISLHHTIKETPFAAEGTDVRFGFSANGRVFKVESKDEYRKRKSGRSPDYLDATVLAFAELNADGILQWAKKRLAAVPVTPEKVPENGLLIRRRY